MPQLCHFLITRPSSVAVELLVLELSQRSTHFAIQTYWYFQAYHSDIAHQNNHPSYRICRRILRKCQQILFHDQATGCKPEGPAPNLIAVNRVRENFKPSLIGMASIMAGFASPFLAGIPARMAIAEGSKPIPIPPPISNKANLQPPEPTNTLRPSSARVSLSPLTGDNQGIARRKSADAAEKRNEVSIKGQGSFTDPPSPEEGEGGMLIDLASPSLEDLRNGHAFSFFQYLNKNKPAGNLPSSFEKRGSGDLSELGIGDDDQAGSDSELSDSALQPSQSKGHFFHSEIQFVLTLMSISNRLCLVPKASRQSSLQAELALLNHNLPADVCIPLWCEATPENPSHHKLVRISPKDAVVLNSADRVPYLIFVEVLMDEKGSEIEQAEEQKKPVGIPKSYAISGSLPDAFSEFDDPGSPGSPSTQNQNQIYFQSVMSRRSSNAFDEYAESMRTAAVMLAQLTLDRGASSAPVTAKANNHRAGAKETIRARIISEMAALEESRVAKASKHGSGVGVTGPGGESQAGERVDERELLENVAYKEDPSAVVFREDWESKQNRIQAASPFGDRPNWRLLPLIVKTGADLRQEQFALQLISEIERIWKEAGLSIWLKRFNIMVTSNDSGFIEMVRNTISVHSLKKDAYTRGLNTKGVMYSLYDHFVKEFGDPSSDSFLVAQDNFMRSLVGYSLVSYVLQLKDRHNGNILVDTEGHLVHIDFGFMLSNSPGSVGFEMAPFKMTQEYLDILGGAQSSTFREFRSLMKLGFLAIRKHAENLLLLVEMMQRDSKLPCFSGSGASCITGMKERFHLGMMENQLEELVDKLIVSSSCNVFTRLYDTFQYYSNGIL